MITVKVPATSANLGPGFDCLGLALSLYNEVSVEITNDKLFIESLNDTDVVDKDENNLIYKSIKVIYDKLNKEIPPLHIIEKPVIPISRGLGSSAACIVSGLLLGNELLNKPFDKNELLKFATELEGHPDNVAPALFGGFVVSIVENNDVLYIKSPVNKDIKFMIMVPHYQLSTKEARGVLPQSISLKDAVFNISRASFITACFLKSDFNKIKYSSGDKIHQPYRIKLIPDGERVFNKALELGCAAVFISGSGSTLLGVVEDSLIKDKMTEYCSNLSYKWDINILSADNLGAHII